MNPFIHIRTVLVGETRSRRIDTISSGGKGLCASALGRLFGRAGHIFKGIFVCKPVDSNI